MPSNGKVVCDFRNKKDDEGCNLLFSPCGKFIIDGTWEGRLLVRAAATGKIEFEREFPNEMIHDIYAVDGGSSFVVMHDPKTWRRRQGTAAALLHSLEVAVRQEANRARSSFPIKVILHVWHFRRTVNSSPSIRRAFRRSRRSTSCRCAMASRSRPSRVRARIASSN